MASFGWLSYLYIIFLCIRENLFINAFIIFFVSACGLYLHDRLYKGRNLNKATEAFKQAISKRPKIAKLRCKQAISYALSHSLIFYIAISSNHQIGLLKILLLGEAYLLLTAYRLHSNKRQAIRDMSVISLGLFAGGGWIIAQQPQLFEFIYIFDIALMLYVFFMILNVYYRQEISSELQKLECANDKFKKEFAEAKMGVKRTVEYHCRFLALFFIFLLLAVTYFDHPILKKMSLSSWKYSDLIISTPTIFMVFIASALNIFSSESWERTTLREKSMQDDAANFNTKTKELCLWPRFICLLIFYVSSSPLNVDSVGELFKSYSLSIIILGVAVALTSMQHYISLAYTHTILITTVAIFIFFFVPPSEFSYQFELIGISTVFFVLLCTSALSDIRTRQVKKDNILVELFTLATAPKIPGELKKYIDLLIRIDLGDGHRASKAEIVENIDLGDAPRATKVEIIETIDLSDAPRASKAEIIETAAKLNGYPSFRDKAVRLFNQALILGKERIPMGETVVIFVLASFNALIVLLTVEIEEKYAAEYALFSVLWVFSVVYLCAIIFERDRQPFFSEATDIDNALTDSIKEHVESQAKNNNPKGDDNAAGGLKSFITQTGIICALLFGVWMHVNWAEPKILWPKMEAQCHATIQQECSDSDR